MSDGIRVYQQTCHPHSTIIHFKWIWKNERNFRRERRGDLCLGTGLEVASRERRTRKKNEKSTERERERKREGKRVRERERSPLYFLCKMLISWMKRGVKQRLNKYLFVAPLDEKRSFFFSSLSSLSLSLSESIHLPAHHELFLLT